MAGQHAAGRGAPRGERLPDLRARLQPGLDPSEPIVAPESGESPQSLGTTDAPACFGPTAPTTEPATEPGGDAETGGWLSLTEQIAGVGSWHYDRRSRRLRVSRSFARLHGLDDLADAGGAGPFLGPDPDPATDYRTIDDDRIRDWVDAEDRAAYAPLLRAALELGRPCQFRYRLRRPTDHALRWFDGRAMAQRDATGAIIGLLGTATDVTDVVQSEERLHAAHAELVETYAHHQAVISATPDVIHVYDTQTGELSRANRVPRPLSGFAPGVARVLTGDGLAELVPTDDRVALAAALASAARLPDGGVAKVRHRVCDGGTVHWLSRWLTPFARDARGAVTELLVISRDVTDVVDIEQRLEYAALHDELTGLANRRLVHDRLEQALLRSARGGHVAVLLGDLDGFKRINDAFGHQIGDAVLAESARRLGQVIRTADTIARMGGDEFALVLDIPQHEDPSETAEAIAARVTAVIAEPILVEGVEHTVSMSIGVTLSADAASPAGMLADADAAMYYIKGRGGNGFAFFEDAQRPDASGRNYLERQLRRALAEDRIDVHYQPIVDPRTNRVLAVEALLRVRDEHGRPLDPAAVVEVAEASGLIGAVDERVLLVACAQAVRWRADGLAHLVLKVNRSARDITRPGFRDRIVDALAATGLDPHALTLEITETVLLDATEESVADLRLLADAGVGLAIDDFGTGYASLRYLAELPISCIKIDRSFIQGLPDNTTAMTLVQATVGLAEQLDIDCIVEGVETEQQLRALPSYDRLHIQGYLYARPQSADIPLPAVLRPQVRALRAALDESDESAATPLAEASAISA